MDEFFNPALIPQETTLFAVWLLGRSGIALGRLPGDLRFSFGGASCFLPLATSLLLSLILTLLLNLILRLPRK